MLHLGSDKFTSQRGGIVVSLLLREMPLQHGVRRPLPEIRFEYRREGEPATGPPAADPISPRRHRPGR